jgi:aryl-alcohol dehydrogenase-like predicted oxidoreductase
MRYNQLGSTGLLVSELCLGTMTFGGVGVFGLMGDVQQSDADSMVRRALDAGINFIDTADVYSAGQSEIITGAALKNVGIARSDVVLATKGYSETGPGPNDRGASRGHIMDAVHASLKRLNTDYIDLYQIHGYDTVTPVEETLRALDDLVSQGSIRYVGASNARAWEVMKAVAVSDKRGWVRFESLQAYYSLAGRDLEREILSMLQDQKLGLLVWSPLAGGFLSGKVSRSQKAPEGSRRASLPFPPVDEERAYACIDAMRPIAEAHNVSIAQVALGWLLHQKHVTSVIVGAKRIDQLDDNIAATKLKLDDAELRVLNEVSTLPMEYTDWVFRYFVDPQRFPATVAVQA